MLQNQLCDHEKYIRFNRSILDIVDFNVSGGAVILVKEDENNFHPL